MAFLSTFNIIGSGMTAQQLRLDVISENITNMNTTRTEGGGPYRRKIVTMEAASDKDEFRLAFERARRKADGTRDEKFTPVMRSLRNRGFENAGGVYITEILEDESESPIVYDPSHPDANEAGYVEMPNVILVKEITDAMAASQAFSADVTAFNTLKQVVSSGMDINV